MLLAATALTTTAHAQDPKSFMDPGKDWPTFHGSYKSWNYSPLAQINTENVGKLKVAFIEQVGRSTRGLETTPLAKDGILYIRDPTAKSSPSRETPAKYCGHTFPNSTRIRSPGKRIRPTTAAWRWTTKTCMSAPSMGD